MDFRLQCNKIMTVSGPSHAGKTEFTLDLLEKRESLFKDCINRVIWCYGIFQPHLYNELKERGYIAHDGIIQDHELQTNDLVVLDDLLEESKNSKDVTNMFTRTAHHKNCFIIFITQNLFPPGKESRTRNLNTHYYVIFKNPRDKSQFEIFARQVSPRKSKALIAIFEDATERPHGYLFIDFTQDCPENLRFRTDILENHMTVFKLL
jgi:hypothetical protein